jgi:hypothetical protein
MSGSDINGVVFGPEPVRLLVVMGNLGDLLAGDVTYCLQTLPDGLRSRRHGSLGPRTKDRSSFEPRGSTVLAGLGYSEELRQVRW